MSILYSTGPIENTIGIGGPKVSSTLFVKILNNNKNDPVEIIINFFKLNGPKKSIDISQFSVQPLFSGFTTFNVSQLFQFEIQIEVQGKAAENVLLSVWGQDAEGNLIAAHRILHMEMVRLIPPN